MRVLLIALLAAISYAQTASKEQELFEEAVAQSCVPRDDDECLRSSPGGWGSYSCSSAAGYCYRWAKTMYRCCPETCGIEGRFTQERCETYWRQGDCIYPNNAQPDCSYLHNTRSQGEDCWHLGLDTNERDAFCQGSMKCARNGADGRDFGCNGRHCCMTLKPTTSPTPSPTASPTACGQRDDDWCLQASPSFSPTTLTARTTGEYTCTNGASSIFDYCNSYAKDLRRCCPNSCGTGRFTQSQCWATDSRGQCDYPTNAQPDCSYLRNTRDLHEFCYDEGVDMEGRDAVCSGNSVCARAGEDGRSFGGCRAEGIPGPPYDHHCCSEPEVSFRSCSGDSDCTGDDWICTQSCSLAGSPGPPNSVNCCTRRPQSSCYELGTTTDERDAKCAPEMVCARKGYDGRAFGCNDRHCCTLKESNSGANNPARMTPIGQGFCKESDRSPSNDLGISSMTACNEVCLSESSCNYVAFKEGESCTRFSDTTCTLDHRADYTVFQKVYSARSADKPCHELSWDECDDKKDSREHDIFNNQRCIASRTASAPFSGGNVCEMECKLQNRCGGGWDQTRKSKPISNTARTGVEGGCHTKSWGACCSFKDGRDGPMHGQKCIPSASENSPFNGGSTCEPQCWVEGTCGDATQDQSTNTATCLDTMKRCYHKRPASNQCAKADWKLASDHMISTESACLAQKAIEDSNCGVDSEWCFAVSPKDCVKPPKKCFYRLPSGVWRRDEEISANANEAACSARKSHHDTTLYTFGTIMCFDTTLQECRKFFTMTGDCDIQDNCVSSKNYPNLHGDQESCTVTMKNHAKVTVGNIFNLETCCDHLMIGGRDVEDSAHVPEFLLAGDVFTWNSDYSVQKEGWQLCFDEIDLNLPRFVVDGDGCEVSDNCVMSNNYPETHGNNEECTVAVQIDSRLTVGSTFNLERCCDHLLILGNDVESSDAVPSSLAAGTQFTWSTDGSVTREGWQICFWPDETPITTTPTDESAEARLGSGDSRSPNAKFSGDESEEARVGSADSAIMMQLKETHQKWLAWHEAYNEQSVELEEALGLTGTWDPTNGVSLTHGTCTLSGITQNYRPTGDFNFECEEIALMNGLKIANLSFTKKSTSLDLTGKIMTNINGDGNPQFNVAASLDHQSLEWTFSTELVEEWEISNNFKISKGSINIDSNYDAGLTLGLEVKLGKGNNAANTTFEVIMAKTGQFYNITGTANDFPKFCLGGACFKWKSVRAEFTYNMTDGAWAGSLDTTVILGRNMTITGKLTVSDGWGQLTCRVEPLLGQGTLDDFMKDVTGNGLASFGAPQALQNSVKHVQLIYLEFVSAADRNSTNTISGQVQAFGVNIDVLIKFSTSEALACLVLSKSKEATELSWTVGSLTITWDQIRSLAGDDDMIFLSFATNEKIGKEITDIGSKSLEKPITFKKGFDFQYRISTTRQNLQDRLKTLGQDVVNGGNGRRAIMDTTGTDLSADTINVNVDSRSPIAKFAGEYLGVQSMTLRFQSTPTVFLFETTIDRPITIGNFEMRNFRLYIQQTAARTEFAFALDMKAKFGTVEAPSDLHLRGDIGINFQPLPVPKLGLQTKLTQLSKWENAFGVQGLTIANVFFHGGMSLVLGVVPPVPILDNIGFGGSIKLPSGRSAYASVYLQTSPMPAFYLAMGAKDWSMKDILDWCCTSIDQSHRDIFGAMKFGMFDFELALALGGAAFQSMEVTKGDGTTATLDGARFFFSVQQFQFTPNIGGKQLSFDIGFGSASVGVEIVVDLNVLDFWAFKLIGSCSDDTIGPKLHGKAKVGEFYLFARGGIQACPFGMCGCASLEVEFEMTGLRIAFEINIPGWRAVKRSHWVSWGGRRNLNYDENSFVLFPEDSDAPQAWHGYDQIERAPRKIELAQSCLNGFTGGARVYTEMSKGDCAELCVQSESCTGIVYGESEKSCSQVEEALEPSGEANLECDINMYKVGKIDETHMVAAEADSNVYGSRPELHEVKHLVRCISDDGMENWHMNKCGGTSEVHKWGSCEYLTYEKAVELCDLEGGRLPTLEEVENGCVARSGMCSDSELVWTSDSDGTKGASLDVPAEAKYLDDDLFAYALEKQVSKCELESVVFQSLDECVVAAEALGLVIENGNSVDDRNSPCGCRYDEATKTLIFNAYQDPCGCHVTTIHQCPKLLAPAYDLMDLHEEVAKAQNTQPICQRSYSKDRKHGLKKEDNVRNYIEKEFANNLEERYGDFVLGGEKDSGLFGENPFPKPDISIFTNVQAVVAESSENIQRIYDVQESTAIDAMLYYEKEIEMGSLMKHLNTLTGYCIEFQPYCFAASLLQSELIASAAQFDALEAALKDTSTILDLDTSKQSIPAMLGLAGIDTKKMHDYQNAKADYAAYKAVEIAKTYSDMAFDNMVNAAETDSRVVLTKLAIPDSNFMEDHRSMAVPLRGRGYFLGQESQMGFVIQLNAMYGANNDEMVDEIRRDVHFDFMVNAASAQIDSECGSMESTKRLLIADLIDEAGLEYERQAEEEVQSARSITKAEEILACTRHASFQYSHSRGSDFLVWDFMQNQYVVAAHSNGHWYNGHEYMQSPLISESIYKTILNAHTEEMLNNNDACVGLNANPSAEEQCCEGLSQNPQTGVCEAECIPEDGNPERDGFFVECCSGLEEVQIIEHDSHAPITRCMKPSDLCTALEEPYSNDKPCCDGLMPGYLHMGHVCVQPSEEQDEDLVANILSEELIYQRTIYTNALVKGQSKVRSLETSEENAFSNSHQTAQAESVQVAEDPYKHIFFALVAVGVLKVTWVIAKWLKNKVTGDYTTVPDHEEI